MIDLNRYMKYLEEMNINQKQFFLLYCLYLKKYEILERYINLFGAMEGTAIGRIERDNLIERGFLVNMGKNSEEIDPRDLVVTEKFNRIFVDRDEAGEELLELYPAYMRKDGKDIPLKTIDIYQFRLLYGERIKYSYDEHLEVIKDVKYAIAHDKINCGIEKFVHSEQWRYLRKERLEVETEEVKLDDNDF